MSKWEVILPGVRNQTQKYSSVANLSPVQWKLAILHIYRFCPPFDPGRGVKRQNMRSNSLRFKTKPKNTSLLRIWAQYSENWQFFIFMDFDPHLTPAQGSKGKMRVKLPGIENQTQKYLSGPNLSSKWGKIAIFDIYEFWPPIWPRYRGSNVKMGVKHPGRRI